MFVRIEKDVKGMLIFEHGRKAATIQHLLTSPYLAVDNL